MASIPKSKKLQLFNKALDGVYGHFQTKQSFPLHYLLTSIKTDRLDWLETASDVLDISAINFDEIVQRDIDYVRVQKEIIEEYLEKGKDRVIFFPPLMVTLYGIDGDHPITKYQNIDRSIDDDKYLVTYDKNRFQTELPLTDDQTSHSIDFKGKTYYYYNYAATLRLNSEKVRLVVLDGQHRLTALKKLVENGGKEIVSEIDLPICIFFAPCAGADTQETLSDDMRELFVTINKEAKEVSGHFLWLLKDKSLSAICIRSLGDFWKKKGGEFSYLHQLEWNQREASKADQAQKAYSVTTVSILAEALRSHIFGARGNFAYSLLNLKEVEKKLHTSDTAPPALEINEENFDLAQLEILKIQIDKYITPSLDILFRTPRPYRVIREAFERATQTLNRAVSKDIHGALQFKKDILGKFRSSNRLDQPKVQDMEVQFTEELRGDAELQKVAFFRRNVFHQALIRAWADLFLVLGEEVTLTPKEIAEGLVAGLEHICFNDSVDFLSPYKAYSQLVFFKGERIIVNTKSKTGLRHLIISNFVNGKARSEFIKKTGIQGTKAKTVTTLLETLGFKSSAQYINILQENQTRSLSREWRFADIGERDQQYLEERFNSNDETRSKEFSERINLIAAKRVSKAREVFANVLGIKAGDIPTPRAGDLDSDAVSEL